MKLSAQKSIAIVDAKIVATKADLETLGVALEEAERQKTEADDRAIEDDRQRRIAEAKAIASELQSTSAEADRLMKLLATALANRDRIIDRLAATNAVYPGAVNALRRSSRVRSAVWHAGLGERLNCETVSGQQRQSLGAAFSGSLPIAKLLLEKGAVLEDSANKSGVTPLIVAGEESHVELAEFLIGQGADVNHPEGHGYWPITRAFWKGNTEIIKLFKRHGATCQADVLKAANAAKCEEIHD